MKIVHFGTFSTSEGYPRNVVVAGALEDAGAQVIQCHRKVWGDRESRAGGVTDFFTAVRIILRVAVAWILLAFQYLIRTPDHDLVLVGYPGHLDIFLARILAALRSKPVVLDAFLSLYEAVVEDRKLVAPGTIKARLLKFLDRASSQAAHAVLMDTEEHIRYYRDVIGAKSDHFIRAFVGAEEEFFHPSAERIPEHPGEILFFGSFLPLHGADVIVRAGAMLKNEKDIHLSMIGDGPEWRRCKEIADSAGLKVAWERGWVDYRALTDRIARSEICLGIFSKKDKAKRVIPCKVFNTLAMGKPLITADTPAAREALTHGENAWLVPPDDPEALAEAITTLHKDADLRNRIAAGGLALFRERFSRRAIGKELLAELDRRFNNK